MPRHAPSLLALLLCMGTWSSLLTAAPASAQQVLRVPENLPLAEAFGRVRDGGVIEIAAGVYPSPPGGFRVRVRQRSFTVRAAPGAEVVLTGEEVRTILRLEAGARDGGKVVAFEGIEFENGRTTTESRGGAVVVEAAEAVFTGCEFRRNRSEAPSTGGGAVRVAAGASVRFGSSLFEDNSAKNRGGAISVIDASIAVETSRFVGNRANLAPHIGNATGGAIHAVDSEVTIRDSHFEDNEAGFAGGALFLFGRWNDDVSVPAARAEVEGSSFVGNRVDPDPCCATTPLTFGGAVHAEDQATLVVRGSRFESNEALFGGALSGYRNLTDVADSVFRGNRAIAADGSLGPGGAIAVNSADFADASTDGGAINRRPAGLTVRTSLLQGRFGDTGVSATQGGCLAADGDLNRILGEGGVEAEGSVEENRAAVELDRVVFFDCDVAAHGASPGFGGAVAVRAASLAATGSLFLASDAPADTGVGGGLAAIDFNTLAISDSTFAENTALFGAAAHVLGSSLEFSDLSFLANEVSPGTSESLGDSRAVLFTAPSRPSGVELAVTGVVADSLFAGNRGLAILDDSPGGGPDNRVRYDGNRFRESSFGAIVYRNTAASFGGETVAGLNRLVVGGVDKSEVANRSLGSMPREGQVVGVPSALPDAPPPGSGLAPLPVFLGFAWTGPPGAAARLAGEGLSERAGLLPTEQAGELPLVVDGVEVDAAQVKVSGCTTDTRLCLGRDRFEVEISFRDFSGNTGEGRVVPLATDDSGLFFFFEEDNWEILVKVLDGCAITDHFWVFAAATTNVEYELRVRDTVTGQLARYTNPLGVSSPAITDTAALSGCDAGLRGPGAVAEASSPALPPVERAAQARIVGQAAAFERLSAAGAIAPSARSRLTARAAPMTDCVPGPEALCLNGGRFRVEVDFRDFSDFRGTGKVVPVSTDDSGLFFFFDEDNWEMLVKVLNGCPVNGRVWVFAAATTNVEFTLRVTDTVTGAVREYPNPLGVSADAVTDTDAFAACP